MSRRCLVIAATLSCAACPSGTGGPSPSSPSRSSAASPAQAGDAPLRLRIAQAEARRAGGVDELAELAAHGAPSQRRLALRGLGRIGRTGGPRPIAVLVAALGDADPSV